MLIQTKGFGSAPRQPGKFTYVQMTLLPDPVLALAGCCPGAHGVHAEFVSGTATGRKRPEAVLLMRLQNQDRFTVYPFLFSIPVAVTAHAHRLWF